MNISLNFFTTPIEENEKSKVEDEVIIDVNDNIECDTNEKKDNKDMIITKGIDNNDEMNIRSTVSKEKISLSNDKIVKKVTKMDDNNFDKILQLQTQITTLLTIFSK